MFEALEKLPPDPILGVLAAYRADTNPLRVDLGVGVYRDEDGNTPILDCVKDAEAQVMAAQTTKSYMPQAGVPTYNEGMRSLLFGAAHGAIQDNRVRTVQAPGGCGGLRIAAELINKSRPDATLWVSEPTWNNHVPLLGNAGITLREYAYYDYDNNNIRFDAMMEALAAAGPSDLVLLHGCCHNPCGADLSREQWDAVAEAAQRQQFTPFIDIAYQGLGDGIDEDVYGLRLLAEKVPEVIVASSCSKNFGLYRERIGATSIVAATPDHADAAQSQLLSIARGMYSMPPSHGAEIVGLILNDPQLRARWEQEINHMRERLNTLRRSFAEKMQAKGASRDFGFIAQQRGLFSFLGISKEQINALREQFSIYMVDSSRVNIAGVSQRNIDYVTDALISVL